MARKKGQGFTLVELAAALGVAGSLALVSAEEGNFETSQMKARALGNEIFHYNSAVSRYLSHYANDTSIAGTYVGSSWLKGPGCPGGLAIQEFLSCDLLPDDKTVQYQSQPRTDVVVLPSGALEARTVWDTIRGNNGDPDTMVMGISALIASGNVVSQLGDAGAAYQSPTIFCPETAGASVAVPISMLSCRAPASMPTWITG